MTKLTDAERQSLLDEYEQIDDADLLILRSHLIKAIEEKRAWVNAIDQRT